MEFVLTSQFEKSAAGLLTDDQRGELEVALAIRPDAGAVIQGSGGVRKVRFAATKGKGKSGGARVIYYWARSDHQIFFLYAYGKGERTNLTGHQARLLREAAGL